MSPSPDVESEFVNDEQNELITEASKFFGNFGFSLFLQLIFLYHFFIDFFFNWIFLNLSVSTLYLLTTMHPTNKSKLLTSFLTCGVDNFPIFFNGFPC